MLCPWRPVMSRRMQELPREVEADAVPDYEVEIPLTPMGCAFSRPSRPVDGDKSSKDLSSDSGSQQTGKDNVEETPKEEQDKVAADDMGAGPITPTMVNALPIVSSSWSRVGGGGGGGGGGGEETVSNVEEMTTSIQAKLKVLDSPCSHQEAPPGWSARSESSKPSHKLEDVNSPSYSSSSLPSASSSSEKKKKKGKGSTSDSLLLSKSSKLSSSSSDSSEEETTLSPEDYEAMPEELRAEHADIFLISSEEEEYGCQRLKELFEAIQVRECKFDPKSKLVNCKVCLLSDVHTENFKIHSICKALERCTYAFLLVTKTFCLDKWAEFQKNEVLMRIITDEKRRWGIVPLYTQPKHHSDPAKRYTIPSGLISFKGMDMSRLLRDSKSIENLKNLTDGDQYFYKGLTQMIQEKIDQRLMRQKEQEEAIKKWVKEKSQEKKTQKLYRKKQERLEKERARNERTKALASLPSELPCRPTSLPSYSQEPSASAASSSSNSSQSSSTVPPPTDQYRQPPTSSSDYHAGRAAPAPPMGPAPHPSSVDYLRGAATGAPPMGPYQHHHPPPPPPGHPYHPLHTAYPPPPMMGSYLYYDPRTGHYIHMPPPPPPPSGGGAAGGGAHHGYAPPFAAHPAYMPSPQHPSYHHHPHHPHHQGAASSPHNVQHPLEASPHNVNVYHISASHVQVGSENTMVQQPSAATAGYVEDDEAIEKKYCDDEPPPPPPPSPPDKLPTAESNSRPINENFLSGDYVKDIMEEPQSMGRSEKSLPQQPTQRSRKAVESTDQITDSMKPGRGPGPLQHKPQGKSSSPSPPPFTKQEKEGGAKEMGDPVKYIDDIMKHFNDKDDNVLKKLNIDPRDTTEEPPPPDNPSEDFKQQTPVKERNGVDSEDKSNPHSESKKSC